MFNTQAPSAHIICDEPVARQQQSPEPTQGEPKITMVNNKRRKRRRSSRGPLLAATGGFAAFHRTVTPDDIDLKKPRQLQQSSQQQQQLKVVDFSDTISQQVISRDFSTADQWYNRQEYSEFKANVKKDVMHLAELVHQNSIREVDFNEHSVVGIEKYCCSGAQQDTTRNSRAQLVRTVLDQQSMQQVIGTKDPEMIRMLCQLHTQESSQRAQERAQAFRWFSFRMNALYTAMKLQLLLLLDFMFLKL